MPNLERAAPFEIDVGERAGIVLLHGFTGAPQEVEPIARALAPHGVSSIGPLLPGHGEALTELNRVAWREWTAAAESTLAEARRRWPTVLVGGLSMGGALALHLAAHHSTTVLGVLALATPLRLRHRALPLLPLLSRFLLATPKKGMGVSDSRLAADRVSYDHQPLAGVLQLTHLLSALRRELHAVRCPLFLAHSRGDRTIPFANMAEIARRVSSPEIDLLELTRSDHILPLDVERKQLFGRIVAFVTARVGD